MLESVVDLAQEVSGFREEGLEGGLRRSSATASLIRPSLARIIFLSASNWALRKDMSLVAPLAKKSLCCRTSPAISGKLTCISLRDGLTIVRLS